MPDTNSAHILVIDDDEVDVMFVQRELNKLNVPFNFHVARNGVEALSQLQDHDKALMMPKIIVLDLMMPKMNGIEFLKELRAQTKFDFITVLVLTTSNNERDRIATDELRVDGYFVKDKQFEDFIDHCKHLLTK